MGGVGGVESTGCWFPGLSIKMVRIRGSEAQNAESVNQNGPFPGRISVCPGQSSVCPGQSLVCPGQSSDFLGNG